MMNRKDRGIQSYTMRSSLHIQRAQRKGKSEKRGEGTLSMS